MSKVSYRSQETSRGWSKRAPKTKAQRRALLARCGRAAFLQPDKLKYPVMAKDGPCVIDCRGLRAALSWGARYAPTVERKARAIGRRGRCAWTIPG